jgi:hypothetical protein
LKPRRRDFELSNPEQEKSTSKPNDDIFPIANLNRCIKQYWAPTANSSVWASPVHSIPNCLVNVVRKECHLGIVSISRIASRNGQRRFYNLRTFLLRIGLTKAVFVPAIRFSFSEHFVSLPRRQNQNLLETQTENQQNSDHRKRNLARCQPFDSTRCYAVSAIEKAAVAFFAVAANLQRRRRTLA